MIGITSISFSKAARTLGQLLASLFIRLYLNHWVSHGVHNYRWCLYCACNIISVSRMMFLSHNGNHPSTGWRTSEFRMEERENPSAWRAPCTTPIIFGWSLESSESSNMSSSSRSAWFAYLDIYLGEQIQMQVKTCIDLPSKVASSLLYWMLCFSWPGKPGCFIFLFKQFAQQQIEFSIRGIRRDDQKC